MSGSARAYERPMAEAPKDGTLLFCRIDFDGEEFWIPWVRWTEKGWRKHTGILVTEELLAFIRDDASPWSKTKPLASTK